MNIYRFFVDLQKSVKISASVMQPLTQCNPCLNVEQSSLLLIAVFRFSEIYIDNGLGLEYFSFWISDLEKFPITVKTVYKWLNAVRRLKLWCKNLMFEFCWIKNELFSNVTTKASLKTVIFKLRKKLKNNLFFVHNCVCKKG